MSGMARSHRQPLEDSRKTRQETQKPNSERGNFTMTIIEEHQPLLSSLELATRQNRDAHLKSVLDNPLRIPGLESLSTMQQTIAELQEKYELEAQRLATEQATLEGLNSQLETECKKLSHGEFLFVGSKAALDTLSATIGQCLTSSEQSKLQSVLLVRAGNVQFCECWPSVKKAIQAEIKRLESEIKSMTQGGEK